MMKKLRRNSTQTANRYKQPIEVSVENVQIEPEQLPERQKNPPQPSAVILQLPHQQSEAKTIRRVHSPYLYGLVVFSLMCYIGYFVAMLLTEQEIEIYAFFGMSGVTIIISLMNSWFFCNWKQMLYYYFMVDNIMLTGIATDIAYSYRIVFLSKFSTQIIVTKIVFFVIVNVIIAGNFRVMMKRCLWNKKKVIIFKLALVIAAVCFVYLGIHLVIVDIGSLNNQAPAFQSSSTPNNGTLPPQNGSNTPSNSSNSTRLPSNSSQTPPNGGSTPPSGGRGTRSPPSNLNQNQAVQKLGNTQQVTNNRDNNSNASVAQSFPRTQANGRGSATITEQAIDAQPLRDLMIFMYCCNFAFILQIFAKVTDFDGTNDLRRQYVLIGEDQDKNLIHKMLQIQSQNRNGKIANQFNQNLQQFQHSQTQIMPTDNRQGSKKQQQNKKPIQIQDLQRDF